VGGKTACRTSGFRYPAPSLIARPRSAGQLDRRVGNSAVIGREFGYRADRASGAAATAELQSGLDGRRRLGCCSARPHPQSSISSSRDGPGRGLHHLAARGGQEMHARVAALGAGLPIIVERPARNFWRII